MLNMARWIALCAAVVFVVAFAAAVVSTSTSPHQQPQSAEHQNEDQNQKGHKTLWDLWFPDSISVYTLALVIFTAVLAFGGLYQLKFLERAELISAESSKATKEAAQATKEATELTRLTLYQTQSALIFGETISAGAGALESDPNNLVGYKFWIEWKNTGNTPAVNISAWIMYVVVPKKTPDSEIKFPAPNEQTSGVIGAKIGARGKDIRVPIQAIIGQDCHSQG